MVGSRQRAEYYPVHYVEPLMRNDTAIGYDLGSEPVRLAALERARDTGEAVTTGEIALVQESGQQSGFLVIQPIYQNNAPHETIEERGQSLVGFAIGAFHVADMVEAAIEELPQASVNIQIIDESPSESEVVLYSSRGAESEILAGADSLKNSGDLYLRKPLDIPGREWSLFITPTPEYSVRPAWEAWGVLAAGLIITAMLIAYLGTLINYGSKTRKLVAELMTVNDGLRTEVAERKLVEDEIQSFAKFPSEDPNPIIRLGNDGTVLYANPSAIPLLAERGLEVGHTAAKEAMAWIEEALAKSSRAEIEIEFQDGVFSFEVEPVPNAGYVNVYGRNVTAKRRAEEALKESETRLMSMIASAAAGFLLIDSDGTIESFNPAAERLLGYSADEMIGQNVKIIIPKPYHGRHDGYIANYRRTGEAKSSEQGGRSSPGEKMALKSRLT